MTDAIAGSSDWETYTGHYHDTGYVADVSTEFNANGRLAKVRFRFIETYSGSAYLIYGLLHGTSDYIANAEYKTASGGLANTTFNINSAGRLINNSGSKFYNSGPNYVEIVYPYYS